MKGDHVSIRPPRKAIPTALRRKEPLPVRLDDLAERLGPRLRPIRQALQDESDIAVVVADSVSDGDACVLVATRAGVHVSCFGGDAAREARAATATPWASVRVSPLHVERRSSGGSGPADARRYGCDVLVGDACFRLVADDDGGPSGIEAFHDEIVRRGTPWHYPR